MDEDQVRRIVREEVAATTQRILRDERIRDAIFTTYTDRSRRRFDRR